MSVCTLSVNMETIEEAFVTMIMDRLHAIEEENKQLKMRLEALEYPVALNEDMFSFSDGVHLRTNQSGRWRMCHPRCGLDKALDRLHGEVPAFYGQRTFDFGVKAYPSELVIDSKGLDHGVKVIDMLKAMHAWCMRCETEIQNLHGRPSGILQRLCCEPRWQKEYRSDKIHYRLLSGCPDFD